MPRTKGRERDSHDNQRGVFIPRCTGLGRERLAAPPERTVKGPPDFWKGFSLSAEERVRRFVQELEQLGGQAAICHSMDELHCSLRELLQQIQPDSILAWERTSLEQWNLAATLS